MSEPLREPVIPSATRDLLGGRPLRWGFLGAGRIAGTFAAAVCDAGGSTAVTVASRDARRAAAFARSWDIPRSVGGPGGYQQLCEDPEVDVVYINTTHPFHHEQALMAIRSGKHVLVEKPMALNADQAAQLVEEAHAAGLLCLEAMWMRTQPLIRQVQQQVAEGLIGDVVCVQASFPVAVDYQPDSRLFDRNNGGGALLDLGVYAGAFAWMFLGQPQTVHVMGSLAPTGVDQVVAMQWGYDSGATAQLYCTLLASGPTRAVVMGRSGWISVEPPFAAAPTTALVHLDGQPERMLQIPSRGYTHQVDEVDRCIREAALDSPLMPQDATVGVLEILDCARSELGVRYPQEDGGDGDVDEVDSAGTSAKNGS